MLSEKNKVLIHELITSFKESPEKRRREFFDPEEKMDSELFALFKKAAELKRQGRYEESVESYVGLIEKCSRLVSSHIGRGLVKSLCALNEYSAAIHLIFLCFGDTVSPWFSETDDLSLMNASAQDCAYLAKGIMNASNGNPELLMKRTIDVSGGNDYTFFVSREEIIEESKRIMEGKDEFCFPAGMIEFFLDFPVIKRYFASEYTYMNYL